MAVEQQAERNLAEQEPFKLWCKTRVFKYV